MATQAIAKQTAIFERDLVNNALHQIIGENTTPELVCGVLEMDPDRLLEHLESMTMEGQSPWLVGNVFALERLWVDEVGPTIYEYAMLEEHFAKNFVTTSTMIPNYILPKELRQGEEVTKTFSQDAGNLENAKMAALALAKAIGAIAHGEPFDRFSLQLLIGCSLPSATVICKFLVDHKLAEKCNFIMPDSARIVDELVSLEAE